ncbi:MAG: sigma 54-interacting transcriptional regulator [Myxococcota bacterium]
MSIKRDELVTRIMAPASALPTRFNVYVLKVTEPSGKESTHRIEVPRISVGTLGTNTLVLDDDAVSRVHFEILAEAEGLRLRDQGSSNGTYVDGVRCFDTYLRPSARIRAGDTQILFEVQSEEQERPASERSNFGPLIGQSRPMREMYALLEQIAPTNLTVLILGESGTGKELIAEAIHKASPRSGGPFVVFDCSAVPANLIEAELFGHEKGAFTGAEARRTGYLEEADGGTLFLDEIGELPIDLQPKLLRAVEKREVKPLGSTKTKQVDVRLIAATNRDLSGQVNSGQFRSDLYYRLAVMQVRVPPLRERLDDLPILVHHFLQGSVPDGRLRDSLLWEFEQDDYRRLKERFWQGNVRELRNVVEQAVVFGPDAALGTTPSKGSSAGTVGGGDWNDEVVTTESPPEELEASAKARGFRFPLDPDQSMLDQKQAILATFERTYLEQVMRKFDGNFSRASAHAGLDRSYFKRLLKKYGMRGQS